jgi:TPR repeat protein
LNSAGSRSAAAETSLLLPPETIDCLPQSDYSTTIQDVDWQKWRPGAAGVPAAAALDFGRSVVDGGDARQLLPVAEDILERLVLPSSPVQPEALAVLAELHLRSQPPRRKPAIALLKRSLQLEYWPAATRLGDLHADGDLNTPADAETAAFYYKLAVQAEDDDGALALARLERRAGKIEAARRWAATAQQLMVTRLHRGACDRYRKLGDFFSQGVLREPAFEAAIAWYEAGWRNGDLAAGLALSKLLLRADSHANRRRAIEVLTEASVKGAQDATLMLARIHRGDFGGEPDPETAFALLKQASANQHRDLDAVTELARAYRDGMGVAPNRELAITLLSDAVIGGSGAAAHDLASILLASEAPGDVQRGLEILEKVASEGNIPAAANLGAWLLNNPIDGHLQWEKALAWLDRAVAAEHAGGTKVMARFLTRAGQPGRAATLWRRLANLDDVEALVALARIDGDLSKRPLDERPEQLIKRAFRQVAVAPEQLVLLGRAVRDGIAGPPAPEQAFALFERAADLRQPAGQYEAAHALLHGRGVKRDVDAAHALLVSAGGQAYQPANVDLALGLAKGWFGPRDKTSARQSLEAMANAGVKEAARRLADLYASGLFSEFGITNRSDVDAALRLWRRGAELGDTLSMTALADAFASGFAGKPEPKKALSWLKSAAQHGDIEAARRVGAIYLAKLGPDAHDDAEAGPWLARMAVLGGDPTATIQ